MMLSCWAVPASQRPSAAELEGLLGRRETLAGSAEDQGAARAVPLGMSSNPLAYIADHLMRDESVL
jgi:hypothetical protein